MRLTLSCSVTPDTADRDIGHLENAVRKLAKGLDSVPNDPQPYTVIHRVAETQRLDPNRHQRARSRLCTGFELTSLLASRPWPQLSPSKNHAVRRYPSGLTGRLYINGGFWVPYFRSVPAQPMFVLRRSWLELEPIRPDPGPILRRRV